MTVSEHCTELVKMLRSQRAQANDVPYQNCITVTPAAMQEEMSEDIEPAEADDPEMSM
ncbi:hypothetical protein SAMN02910317_03056 [Ruminococcaceae bacterium FB2012]|nr:hypothetical protein SAMN02910317_03056 [Ruminococcaceae bacterium FB2012]